MPLFLYPSQGPFTLSSCITEAAVCPEMISSEWTTGRGGPLPLFPETPALLAAFSTQGLLLCLPRVHLLPGNRVLSWEMGLSSSLSWHLVQKCECRSEPSARSPNSSHSASVLPLQRFLSQAWPVEGSEGSQLAPRLLPCPAPTAKAQSDPGWSVDPQSFSAERRPHVRRALL